MISKTFALYIDVFFTRSKKVSHPHALGTLARYGPQHGHRIRRLADLTDVGEWGGVSVGALYRERDRLVISGRELTAKRERGLAIGYLSPVEAATMRRGELHIETEVRWHDELDAVLAAGAPLDGNAGRRGSAARQALAARIGLDSDRDITR